MFKSIMVFLLLVTLFEPVVGEVPVLRFTDPLKEKSLTSEIATDITQDGNGFIWIGTNDGLNCYNGYKINKYKNSLSDTTSLVNNEISCLFMDSSKQLWVGTHLGICLYNKYYDNFTTLASEQDYAGLESLQITEIKQDNEGNTFISAGKGLYIFNDSTKTFKAFCQIPSGTINSFLFDNKGKIWVGSSDDGLYCYNFSGQMEANFNSNTNTEKSLNNNIIRGLAIRNNKLWIATYGGGINSMDLDSRQFTQYPLPDQYAAYSTSVYVDNENNLWSIDLTGLKFFDEENNEFFGYYTIEGDDKSIKNGIVKFFQDRQGNYWSVHAPGGVGFRVSPKGFRRYDKNPNNYWHTSNNIISAIEIDGKGNWWIGNGFNGIDIFDWENENVFTYHDEQSNPYSLGKGGILSLYRDKQNVMWIGTNLGGLQYFNEEDGRFFSYVNNPDDPNSIANNDIRSITEDKDGNLWIVTHGKGIDKFDRSEGVFYHYTNSKNNLANDWAFQALFDSDETLWVATAWGLSRMPKGDSIFQSYWNEPSDTNSISANIINCIFEDSKGRFWIGTSAGLNRFNPETDNFTSYFPGFTSNNILAIEEGEKNIWVSTSKGISKFDPETGEAYNFDDKDGLTSGSYQPRSAYKSADGRLFFGSGTGLTVFNPSELKFNTTPPDVFITSLNLFFKPIDEYKPGSILNKQISYLDKIELNYNQNVINFEFVANNLINVEKNKFKYKMEGLDKEWVDAGNNNTANYSHLAPGKYTFRVIACNNDGVWNEEGASLRIEISPPWWQSLLFRIAALILIAGIILLIFRLRMSSLKRRNEWLAQKVEERTAAIFAKNKLLKKSTKELKQTNKILKLRQETIQQQSNKLKSQSEELKLIADNLEDTNRELLKTNATKDKLFSIIGHDLKSPFNVILGYTDLLLENLKEWDDEQVLELLSILKESSIGAYNLLDNLLNWARSQSGDIVFYPEKIEIPELTDHVLSDVSAFSRKKEVEIFTRNTGELSLIADSNMLNLICRNLLMNAIKFSKPGGKIFFETHSDQRGFIQFSVKDEGIGMPAEIAGSLFDLEKNISTPGTAGEKGTGLGLILCKEFVNIHKGKIWVESEPGKGATFYFTIPVKG